MASILVLAAMTAAQIQGHTAYAPYGPWTDGISGSLGGAPTFDLAEGSIYDTLVTGSDSDEYAKIPTGEVTVIGNWKAVVVGFLGPDTSIIPIIPNASNYLGTSTTAQSAGSVTYAIKRGVKTFNLEPSDYPLLRVDRYSVYDNAPISPVPSMNHLLRDTNTVILQKWINVSKKVTTGGGGGTPPGGGGGGL
ncbi:hypothetical protein BH11ARM2_BH11ARM2_15590 [soil metagenome]